LEQIERTSKPLRDMIERMKASPAHRQFMELQAKIKAQLENSPLFEIIQSSRRDRETNLLAGPSSSK
jgi:hypothetical protein